MTWLHGYHCEEPERVSIETVRERLQAKALYGYHLDSNYQGNEKLDLPDHSSPRRAE